MRISGFLSCGSARSVEQVGPLCRGPIGPYGSARRLICVAAPALGLLGAVSAGWWIDRARNSLLTAMSLRLQPGQKPASCAEQLTYPCGVKQGRCAFGRVARRPASSSSSDSGHFWPRLALSTVEDGHTSETVCGSEDDAASAAR